MRREDYLISILLVALLGVAVWTISHTIGVAIRAITDMAVAIISATTLIFGGILTHTLTQIREQRLQQERLMQENYKAVIEKIDEVIRKTSYTSDDFSKVHLVTWMVGSVDVIRSTQLLMQASEPAKKGSALNEMVIAMRKDIGLSPTPKDLTISNVFLKRDEGHL